MVNIWFFGCFGFGGNFGAILLSLLCALITLLMLSVTLVIELDFDDVAKLLGMGSFSLISLTIFCLVNGKLLVALPSCVFDMPSKSRLLSLQILLLSKFSANLINCNLFWASFWASFSSSSSKIFYFSRSSLFLSNLSFAWIASNSASALFTTCTFAARRWSWRLRMFWGRFRRRRFRRLQFWTMT